MSIRISSLVSLGAFGGWPVCRLCRSGRSSVWDLPPGRFHCERVFKAAVNCLFDAGRFATHPSEEPTMPDPTARHDGFESS
jgi:hypothetical protein